MNYQLHAGICENVLKSISDNSVDSIITDPPYGLKFMGKKWDYQVPTVDQWRECLRVLKPGGYLVAFGGARTYHRLVLNIEDAGLEIRDQLMWIYGSGFPKSLNLRDEFAGKGTALKPAHEPIVLARKPLEGTVLENVIKYGTGVINIDNCRVPVDGQAGRWPANVIHDGSNEVRSLLPKSKGQQGDLKETGKNKIALNVYSDMGPPKSHKARIETDKSAARFFYCAKTTKQDRDEGLEHFITTNAADMTGRKENSAGLKSPRSGAGRTSGSKNNHPTVKPTALMRYLCSLVTPATGVILDPFMGSGSTGKAALLDGFKFIGIEMDPHYVAISAARIAWASKNGELRR